MSSPSSPTLYRAPFVVPVATPPIADGGVLVDDGQIVAVDRFARLRSHGATVVDVDDAIIAPALINCHAHLELSHLAGFVLSGPEGSHGEGCAEPSDFPGWIRALLARRGQPVPEEVIMAAGRKALVEQHERGVSLVTDIGNQPASRDIGAGAKAECQFFRELLAVAAGTAASVLASLTDDEQCTAHAPYSCHPVLIKALKERARRSGGLFPLHVAESAEEVAFLRTGSGPFHAFLKERLNASGGMTEGQTLADILPHPGCGAVEYLNSLGVLDAQTICVHTVHISDAEGGVLAKAGAKVCLCPGSNRTLGVGKAPLPLLLNHRILPGLGTDSLASNNCLDLWQEMKVLQEDHPGVSPEQIFAMATWGGAVTLGVANRLGLLAPGLEARILAIDFTGSQGDLFPALVSAGTAQQVTWLEGGE